VPNGPEHEQMTPTVTGDPDAAAAAAVLPLPADALVAALADDELLLLLLDEHAPTETKAVRAAAVTAANLRRRTM
jgi:hypothetical protein